MNAYKYAWRPSGDFAHEGKAPPNFHIHVKVIDNKYSKRLGLISAPDISARDISSQGLFDTRTFGTRTFRHGYHGCFLARECFSTGTFWHKDILAQQHPCQNICAKMSILLCTVPKFTCAETSMCQNVLLLKCPSAGLHKNLISCAKVSSSYHLCV